MWACIDLCLIMQFIVKLLFEFFHLQLQLNTENISVVQFHLKTTAIKF